MTPADSISHSASDKILASESKLIAKGAVIVMVSTVAALGIGMINTIWIARVLGPDQYGLLTLALSTLLPIITLAAFGLDKTLVRFIPINIGSGDKSLVAGTLFSAFIIAAVASIVVTLAVIFLSPFIANLFNDVRLVSVLRILALTIPLSVFTLIATSATRGLKVMHFEAIVKIANPLSRLVIWIAGILILVNMFQAAIYASLFSALFSAIVALVVVFFAFRRYFNSGVQWVFKSVISYSTPLLLSTLMYALSPRIDRMVMGVVADVYAVGIYSAAASLTLILKLLHSSITMTFSPIVADAYNRSSVNRAKALYTNVTRWDARLTFLAVVAAILLASELLWLFGQSYSSAIMPFIILAISVYAGTIAGPTGAFLQMTNRQRIDAINAVIFFIMAPALQFGFAYLMGWIGVAVGVLVTMIVINIIQVVEIKYIYNFHPFHKDHLLFTILSLPVVVFCAYVGLNSPLITRLALLLAIMIGFWIFVYRYRTPGDTMLVDMILSKIKKFRS